ncbi:MAG: hypothetical protein LBF77_06555 [Spirochaetaceae bacterium]|jgi:hypothetical protein|nr:hypothetical protein [Spirochaetaceae bacterium]
MTAIKERVSNERKVKDGRNRDLLFSIPSRIILSAEGMSFFLSHKRQLHCFETADGERHFGFHIQKAGFAWVKKLLLKGYIRKIEIQVKDITSYRRHLEDGVRMVFFSMLRRRISLSVMEYIYTSPLVKAWNRKNPKKSFGPGVRLAEENIRRILSTGTGDRIEDLKAELYRNIIGAIPPSVWDAQEDPRSLYNFIREVTEDFNLLVFFVLAGSRGEDRLRLLRDISVRVRDLVMTMDILNLASLLVIELVSAAERSGLVRTLENTATMNIRSILESPSRRKALMEEKDFRGSTVVISIPADANSENRRLRFRFSVHNDGADAEAERKLMEDVTERSYSFNEGRRLAEFFKTPPSKRGSGVYDDNGLCFYYLTILQEQCRAHKILLDANIKQSDFGDSVVTTLRFGL